MSGHRQLRNTYGGYRPRHMVVDVEQAERDAKAGIACAEAEFQRTRQRFHHPAIEPPIQKRYRVIRRYRLKGELRFEDIAACKTLGQALEVSIRELGYAVILDPNNRQVSYNGQPLEERTA